jgi:cytochrome c553
MNKLLTPLLALAVASVTALALAQAPAAPAASNAPAAAAAKTAAAPAANPKSLEAKVAMCYGCHNIVGYRSSFPEVYRVPKIAGQGAKYIITALNEYKHGDRKHPTMRGIATTLTDQDMADIAAYYEGLGKDPEQVLPATADKTPDPKVAGLLQKAACVSCHGANFAKPIDPTYPKIAGQNADYLFVALKAYKTSNNPNVGRSNPIMGAMAKQFSNDELKTLANYVGSLEGDLKTVPEHRFHH